MFKTIDRYPDYEINEDGDIRRIDTLQYKKPYLHKGRLRLNFSNSGKTEYVSRLVAETFIPNPENKSVIKHLDGDLENNNVSNLEWCDKWVTQKDSYGLGINAPGGSIPPKRIMIIETGETFSSIKECARHIDGSPSGIRQCLKHEITNHKGFTFKLLI